MIVTFLVGAATVICSMVAVCLFFYMLVHHPMLLVAIMFPFLAYSCGQAILGH